MFNYLYDEILFIYFKFYVTPDRVMIVMAVLNTINMGCALDLAVVKKNIIRPVGPIVGFISQFTFMPLVG